MIRVPDTLVRGVAIRQPGGLPYPATWTSAGAHSRRPVRRRACSSPSARCSVWATRRCVAQVVSSLTLAAGNRDGYRRACDKLVDRFGSRDKPAMLSTTAYACVAAPEGVVEPTLLVTIAHKGVADFEG